MRASVVINTYNRGPSLRQTLRALRHQTCRDFEVIVVNGPSTDDTPAVLAEFAGAVRVGHCPEVHLSRSRNIGIAMAAGDVVAFIDDDALPEPAWLAQLLAAYDAEHVGGTGGVVFDHTGFRLQYRYAVCDRTGSPRFDVSPPFDAFARPGADPFVYLQGTNASFRRRCLVEVGGFDEEIEYYLDEVEVCMRVLDRGHVIRPLAGAAVHHKYLASNLRSAQKVILNPYPLVKNRAYFALQNGLQSRSVRAVRRLLAAYADGLRADCEAHFAAGRLDAGRRQAFVERLERGLHDGMQRGLEGRRRHCPLPPADERQFLPYPVVRPAGKRLTFCVIEQETEAGKWRAEGLATELAALGHEVHLIARSGDGNRVDFADGVWRHGLAAAQRHVPSLAPFPWKERLYQAVAVYQEVTRTHARCPLDAVLVPLPAREGLLCALDDRFTTLLLDAATDDQPGPLPGGELHGAVLRRSSTAVRCPLGIGFTPPGARVVRLAQAACQSRLPSAPPAEEAVRRVVAGHLAAILAEATGLTTGAARRTAERLLDPSCYPVDYRAAVLHLWPCPEMDFVAGLFVLLLGREADPPSRERYLSHLRRGMPRAAVVKHIALSREAGEQGLPLAWLKRFLLRPPAEAARRVPLLARLHVLATRLAWAARQRLRRAG
jgi:glycosyltransferase involved in cell wall biosynthesis